MLLFQIIILIFILFALSRTVLQFRKSKLSLRSLIFWLIFWVAVGIVVILPDTTSRLAGLVGVTRGVDLVIYVAIVALFYLVFRILVKIESLEQDITSAVRQAALEEKSKKG